MRPVRRVRPVLLPGLVLVLSAVLVPTGTALADAGPESPRAQPSAAVLQERAEEDGRRDERDAPSAGPGPSTAAGAAPGPGATDETGPEQAGAEPAGAGQAGADQAGADQAGAGQAGADQAGAGQAGADQAGSLPGPAPTAHPGTARPVTATTGAAPEGDQGPRVAVALGALLAALVPAGLFAAGMRARRGLLDGR